MKFEKQNCNLFHPSKLAHSAQDNFKNFARGTPVDTKKKMFRPIGVINFWHKLGLGYTFNQRGDIPPHAPLQWRSDANCRPGFNN